MCLSDHPDIFRLIIRGPTVPAPWQEFGLHFLAENQEAFCLFLGANAGRAAREDRGVWRIRVKKLHTAASPKSRVTSPIRERRA